MSFDVRYPVVYYGMLGSLNSSEWSTRHTQADSARARDYCLPAIACRGRHTELVSTLYT